MSDVLAVIALLLVVFGAPALGLALGRAADKPRPHPPEDKP